MIVRFFGLIKNGIQEALADAAGAFPVAPVARGADAAGKRSIIKPAQAPQIIEQERFLPIEEPVAAPTALQTPLQTPAQLHEPAVTYTEASAAAESNLRI